jgi:hypothetical protein
MASPDGTATPVDPMMMGDGDMLGDGQIGPEGTDPEAPAVEAESLMAEQQIRETLVSQAYGANVPKNRTVDKE